MKDVVIFGQRSQVNGATFEDKIIAAPYGDADFTNCIFNRCDLRNFDGLSDEVLATLRFRSCILSECWVPSEDRVQLMFDGVIWKNTVN